MTEDSSVTTVSTLNVVIGNRTVTPAYPIVSDAFPRAEDLANDKRLEAFMSREVRNWRSIIERCRRFKLLLCVMVLLCPLVYFYIKHVCPIHSL